MTPETVIKQAKNGSLLPLYVVVGAEQFLRDQVVSELRTASIGGGVAAFNEDRFTAGEADPSKVIAAARTVPMMANRRFVLIRNADRWDAGDGEEKKQSPLDLLTEYAANPVPSTCMVVVATKLDGRRKFVSLAKKQDFLVSCEVLDDRALTSWIVSHANEKGNSIERDVAELIAQLVGPELLHVADAVERLALYVGEGQPIGEHAVSECVARIRTADTWALVDTIGARDLSKALRLLADVYDPRDRGLPLLGAVTWSIRQLLRFQVAILSGASADEAAKAAGVYQAFRARELATKVRGFAPRELERWLLILAETDVALKSSRRSPDAILEDALTRMCRK